MWDDLIVFAVFAAIAGIQLLVRFIQAQKNRADTPPPRSGGRPEPAPATPRRAAAQPDDEEERMRKFLEALGIPTEEAPPPPIARQEAPEPPPLFQPPPLEDEPVFRRPVVVEPPPPLAQPQPRQPARAKRQPKPDPILSDGEGPKALIARPLISGPNPDEIQDMAQPISAASAYEVKQSPKRSRSHGSVRLLLADRRTLRDAIILREVLGPPKAMQ